MRGYQAQQGRELSRCLKELRLLRREPLAECTDEPESASRNEPGSPPEPANDDASHVCTAVDPTPATAMQNKPERALTDELPEAARAEFDLPLAAAERPGLARLADLTLHVVEVAGGEQIHGKAGPGITGSDLLVSNATDVAPPVGADLGVMEADAGRMCGERPFVMANQRGGVETAEVIGFIAAAGGLSAAA